MVFGETSTQRVSAVSHPFKNLRIDYAVPVGLTILEIIEIIQPDEILRVHGVAFIDDELIPRDQWRFRRPPENTCVSIRLLPTGGGIGRILAMVAIAVLAIGLTVALGPAGLGLVAPWAATLIGAGVLIGGTLLVNTLLPAPLPALSKDYGTTSTAYVITGARNTANRWGKLPFVLGRFRVVPPYASLPYREVLGGQIYWRALCAISHGPVQFEDFRIGTTDIGEFQGIEIETRRGYWSFNARGNWSAAGGVFPSDPIFGDQWQLTTSGSMGGLAYFAGQSITYNGIYGLTHPFSWDVNEERQIQLFLDQVFEDSLAAKVAFGAPVIRAGQLDSDILTVEIVFDRGLVHLENNPPGKHAALGAAIRVEQSPIGANTWTVIIETTIRGQQTEPLFWGWRWRTNAQGAQDSNKQYDVRVTRLNPDEDEQRNFGNYSWYSLKSETYNAPLPIPGIAYLAMRVKASGQLSGALDEINSQVVSVAKDWDATSETWIWRPTLQPAALFRHVLQHPTREIPTPDSRIDLEKLSYWYNITWNAGRGFSGVYDSKGSLWTALVDISRVGRAVPTLRDLIYSVIIDEPKTAPIRMFTPRNSRDYTGDLTHALAPDAYRISFANEELNWGADEVIVYDDGKNAANARRIDRVEWIGITNHAQAWKEGRVHLAQQRLRREVYKITTDFEHLCCERGDLVALQYDTIAVGIGSARVRGTTDNGTSILTVTLDATFTVQLGLSYGIRVRRIVAGAQRTDLYALNTTAGDFSTFTITTPPLIDNGPSVGDLVAFGQLDTESLRVLVRDIEPHNDLTAQLTLISEGAGIHVAELGAIPAPNPVVTAPFPPPVIISILSDATVMQVTASRSLITRVVFTITASPVSGTTHSVTLRPTATDGQWIDAVIQEASPTVLKIVGVESGKTYDFRISRTHPDFLSHPSTQVNGYTVVGRSAPPEGLQNLNIAVIGGQALLRWDLPIDLDVQFGGWIIFRHSSAMSGATWGSSVTIGRAVSGDQTHVYLPLKPGTYLARVYDADGRESTTTASISTKQASIIQFETFPGVGSPITEDPTFPGTKTNCEVVSSKLQLTSGDFDSVADVDALPSWDLAGNVVIGSGLYLFNGSFDFAAISRVRLTSLITSSASNVFDLMDSSELLDSPEDFDGTSSFPVDASVYCKLTDDNPAGSPTWGPFMRLDSAEVECRAVGHIECRLTSSDPTCNILVSQLRLAAERKVAGS